jgi:hypothetical protein
MYEDFSSLLHAPSKEYGPGHRVQVQLTKVKDYTAAVWPIDLEGVGSLTNVYLANSPH